MIDIIDIINDNEKRIDFYSLTKTEFLKSYSYLTSKEYFNTIIYIKNTVKNFLKTEKNNNIECINFINIKKGIKKEVFKNFIKNLDV